MTAQPVPGSEPVSRPPGRRDGSPDGRTPRHRVGDDALYRFMGARIEDAADGVARMSLPVSPAVRNLNGRTHGSVIFALFDFTMGAALMSVDSHMAGTATVQMDVHFVRSARDGVLTCESRVVRRGRTVSFAEGEVRDEAGELVARATGVFTTPAPARGA